MLLQINFLSARRTLPVPSLHQLSNSHAPTLSALRSALLQPRRNATHSTHHREAEHQQHTPPPLVAGGAAAAAPRDRRGLRSTTYYIVEEWIILVAGGPILAGLEATPHHRYPALG